VVFCDPGAAPVPAREKKRGSEEDDSQRGRWRNAEKGEMWFARKSERKTEKERKIKRESEKATEFAPDHGFIIRTLMNRRYASKKITPILIFGKERYTFSKE